MNHLAVFFEEVTFRFREMWVICAIGIVVILLTAGSSILKIDRGLVSLIATTSAEAQKTLQEAGFTNIEAGDSVTCSFLDKLGREFIATDPNGIVLTGKICCSYLPVIGDDCAVRFDKTTSNPEVVFY